MGAGVTERAGPTLLLQPAREFGVGVFDAEGIGGAVAGVDAGVHKLDLVVYLAAAILGQDGAPDDAAAVGSEGLVGEALQQAQDQLVATAVGGGADQALAVVNTISSGTSTSSDILISHFGSWPSR
jgi:hypothetical protein